MLKRRSAIAIIILMSWLLIVSNTIFAQQEKSWKDVTSALVGEILIKGNAYEKLLELSDIVGPRVTGTPEYHKSANWAMEQMIAIGLKNVRIEEWPIKEGTWRRGKSEAYLVSPFMHKISAESMGWSPGTPEGGVEAEVLNIGGYRLAEAADPASWANKILLFDPSRDPEPEPGTPPYNWRRMSKLRNKLYAKAAEAGAVAILQPYRVKGNRPHVGGGTARPLPVISVGMEDGQFLQRITRRGDIEVKMFLNFENEFSREEGTGSNVIGEIPGRELPEEIIVVAGHLDSWDTGYGVQDDGTGIIAVLETARAMVALGIQPRRTIRFICLGGEEQGFLGAWAYLEKYQDDIPNHVAMFNHDNGAGEPVGFGIGQDRHEVEKSMSKILDKLANLGATQLWLRNSGGTDAVPFNEAGIPILDMRVEGDGYREIHHQDTNAMEWMERDNFVIGIAFYAACVYSVAENPERIGPVRPPQKEEPPE